MKRRPKPLVPTENLAADADAILQVRFLADRDQPDGVAARSGAVEFYAPRASWRASASPSPDTPEILMLSLLALRQRRGRKRRCRVRPSSVRQSLVLYTLD